MKTTSEQKISQEELEKLIYRIAYAEVDYKKLAKMASKVGVNFYSYYLNKPKEVSTKSKNFFSAKSFWKFWKDLRGKRNYFRLK